MENKRDRHFTEEEIKDKIVQSAEGMEVPDSLKPENIEKKLAQKKKKRTRPRHPLHKRLQNRQLHKPQYQ